jgi:NADH-quinone oxidoreductase subunit K
MSGLLPEYGLGLAVVLFTIGLAGVVARRNLIFVLLSIEIMFNAAGLAFVVAGQRWQQADGQVMYLFLLAVAAAELAVGLALVLAVSHRWRTLDTDALNRMRG